jgi:CHASE1-domain containing sensor protein
VVVVVAGVLLSVGVFLVLRSLDVENARASFDSGARERLDALETNIVLTVNNLISVGAFFDASQRFDRAGFALFSALLLAQNKAIKALEWIPKVPKHLRSNYERAARRDGFPSFQFTERLPHGEIVKARDSEEYFPVFFVEPFVSNEKALGYDLASNTVRREDSGAGDLRSVWRVGLSSGLQGRAQATERGAPPRNTDRLRARRIPHPGYR